MTARQTQDEFSSPKKAHIEALLRQSQYAQALSEIEAILDPSLNDQINTPLEIMYLDALAGLGRWDDCIGSGTRALGRLGPDEHGLRSRVHGMLGYAHMRIGSARKAESHLRAAIHILTWTDVDPEGALREQRRLCLMFKNFGLWSQAEFELQKAIEVADTNGLERESGNLRVNLAIVLLKSGKMDGLTSLLDDADVRLSRELSAKGLLSARLVRANYLRISGHPAKALRLRSKLRAANGLRGTVGASVARQNSIKERAA